MATARHVPPGSSPALAWALVIALSCLVLLPGRAVAQHVTYTVDRCTIEAPASLDRVARALAERAAEILPRLEERLDARPVGPFRMFLLGPDAASDPLTMTLDRAAPEWAAGFMLPESRVGAVRVRLANQYPYGTVEAVFAHEATHLIVHDAVPEGLPRWFDEGVATNEGRRWSLEDMMLYASSLLTTSLPRLESLNAAFRGPESQVRLAYAASASFVAWSEKRYGPTCIADVLREARTRGFDDAWREATRVSFPASEAAWRRDTLLRYRWIPGVIAASGMLWALLGFLTFVGGVRKKLQARAVRARWAEAEALEDAAEADDEIGR